MPKNASERFDVAVVSRDPAALVAAWECARIGLRVIVLEFSDAGLGDAPSNAGGTVAQLCRDVGLAMTISSPQPGEENIYGIPANPFSASVRSVMGWRGAWRIYLDRLMPIMSLGNERSLHRLVRRRLGARALRLLVQPRLARDLGITADIDVANLVPGLGEATTRVGSLTLGVIEMMAADPAAVQRVELAGGMPGLRAALHERLDYFAVTRHRVTAAEVAPGSEPDDDAVLTFPMADSRTASVLVSALLADREFLVPVAPTNLPAGVVGVNDRTPGLPTALRASREAAASVRQALLSRSEKPPVGPVDLGG
jgi:oxygen-dependent protoporphyrinogen oxidase